MDAITLATITSAVTLLASEAGKGAAGEAGKDLWTRIRGLLHLKADTPPPELAPTVAHRLLEDQHAAREVVRLLQQNISYTGEALQIVRSVNAEKVVIITEQTVGGDFNLSV